MALLDLSMMTDQLDQLSPYITFYHLKEKARLAALTDSNIPIR